MAKVGYVGLGVMGGGVARRLLEAGHEVTGYNRTRSKAEALIASGMRFARNAASDAAEQSDVVFSMVTNTEALAAVTEGPDGILAGLGPGKVYVDMSTVSPAASRALAERVAERGAAMLDAPVSGSVITLEQGRLSVIVGGDAAVFERVLPILRDIGPTVTYVGGNGQAVLDEDRHQPQPGGADAGVQRRRAPGGEGRDLARDAVRVLTNSAIASPMVKYRGPFVLEMPEEAWFDCNMMQKDMVLALDLGRELDVPLPSTATANEILTAARGMGVDQHDFAVMFDVLAQLSGLPTPAR